MRWTDGTSGHTRMRRFVLTFCAAICASALAHELGHAIVGLTQGLRVVPTPFKEYVLAPTVDWQQYRVLALGGPIGTLIAVVASGAWFLRRRSADSEAAFIGALLTPAAYSLRYLLVGRGHDGVEWMAAQAALGLRATGHALDGLLFGVVVVGAGAWLSVRRKHVGLRTLGRASGLFAIGLVVLIAGQVGNNALFDPLFPDHRVDHVPADVRAVRE